MLTLLRAALGAAGQLAVGVPARVWLGLLCVAVGAALVGLGWWWHAGAVDAAVEAAVAAERGRVQALVADAERRAEARVLVAETNAAMVRWEKDRESVERERRLAVDLVAVRGAEQRLRQQIAALRGGGGPAGEGASASSLSDAAPALADALSECSSRYAAVAATADQLTGQVIYLQDYVAEVLPLVVQFELPVRVSGGVRVPGSGQVAQPDLHDHGLAASGGFLQATQPDAQGADGFELGLPEGQQDVGRDLVAYGPQGGPVSGPAFAADR